MYYISVSWNENGFWQADLFDTDYCEESPVAYVTGKGGGSMGEIIDKAHETWGYPLEVCLGEEE